MGGALPAIGVGLQVFGQVQQGLAAKSAADFRAQVADNNRRIAKTAAERAIERGRMIEVQTRIRGAQQIGTARASAASRGVEADTGSALVTQLDIAELTERDALQVRQNARLEKARLLQQAQDFSAERELEQATGRQRLAGSLLGAGGTVASKWQDFA